MNTNRNKNISLSRTPTSGLQPTAFSWQSSCQLIWGPWDILLTQDIWELCWLLNIKWTQSLKTSLTSVRDLFYHIEHFIHKFILGLERQWQDLLRLMVKSASQCQVSKNADDAWQHISIGFSTDVLRLMILILL